MARDPFAIHPSPDNYFGSRSHDRALHLLMKSVKEGEPYILVTGEYGAGKTLLCLKLSRFFEGEPDLLAVTVPSPAAPYGQLLRSIAVQLQVTGFTSLCKTVAQFEATLFNLYISGKLRKSVYLVIDDLQDFELQMLVKFRYLTNFHIGDFYPIRLVCFSYTGFIDELEKDPKFVSFLQRFRRRLNIQPLQEDELKEYIYFRLLQAGAKGRPFFDDQSLLSIANITGRVPRLVNNLCDRLLLRAVELRADHIGAELVRDVCRSDELERMPHARSNKISIGNETTSKNTTKKAGTAINLDALTNNYDNEQALTNKTSSPLAWITARHLKIGVLILAAGILLFCLFFLWNSSQGHDNPSFPKDKITGDQSRNSRNGSGALLSSEPSTVKGNRESKKPEERFDTQAQNVSVNEDSINRRITIHQMKTDDSPSVTTEVKALPGEKPYTIEAFNNSFFSDIETKR